MLTRLIAFLSGKKNPSTTEAVVESAEELPELAAPTFQQKAETLQADPAENAATVGLIDIVDSGWFNSATREICPGVEVLESDLIVDVGCGDGGAIKFCANQGANVTFLDINEQKVRSIEAQLSQTARGVIRGIAGTGEKIDIEDQTADKVICTEVLEHVESPEKLLSEMFRIGKSGALYLLTVPHEAGESMMKDTAPPQYFQSPNHIRIFSETDFRQLVEGNGLEILRHDTFGAFWSIFFSIFWTTGGDFGAPDHPALINWSRTWHTILNLEKGAVIKAALDEAIPAKQFILARKP